MNMIRVWGGGRDEADWFYDLCDELGLMVWQDFMFACNIYPSDPAFLNEVRAEVIENVSRIQHHACLALWCGDNELIGALKAEKIGLVNRVVDEQILDETVYTMARTIAEKSGHTLKIGKEAFYQQLEMPLADAYELTSKIMAENMLADDAQEGICAFLDKRKPEWQDS